MEYVVGRGKWREIPSAGHYAQFTIIIHILRLPLLKEAGPGCVVSMFVPDICYQDNVAFSREGTIRERTR